MRISRILKILAISVSLWFIMPFIVMALMIAWYAFNHRIRSIDEPEVLYSDCKQIYEDNMRKSVKLPFVIPRIQYSNSIKELHPNNVFIYDGFMDIWINGGGISGGHNGYRIILNDKINDLGANGEKITDILKGKIVIYESYRK